MSRSDTAVLSLRITAIVVALWGLTQLFFAFGTSLQLEDQVAAAPAYSQLDLPGESGEPRDPHPEVMEVQRSYEDYLRALFLYPGFTYLAIAVLLFLGSRRLARAWFPPAEEQASHRLDTYGAQAVAISIIGLFLLVTTLPGLVFFFADMILPGNAGPMPGFPEGMEGPRGLFFALLKAGFGFALFFGSRRLAASWHRKAGWSSRESS